MSEGLNNTEVKDEEWLNSVPTNLRTIAQRYGQAVFNTTLTVGMVNHAMRLLHKRTGGNRELTQALQMIAISFQRLTDGYMDAVGITQELVTECTKDVELVSQLSPTPSIIVPN